jgi:hypothetical protein
MLAHTDAATDLSKLTELAEKVLEVATATVAALSGSPVTTEVAAQLREEVTHLTHLVESLTAALHNHDSDTVAARHLPRLVRLQIPSVGITIPSETLPRSVKNLALGGLNTQAGH